MSISTLEESEEKALEVVFTEAGMILFPAIKNLKAKKLSAVLTDWKGEPLSYRVTIEKIEDDI